MEHHLQAIVTLLALINPVMCATIFARVTNGQPREAKLRYATKAAFTVLVILFFAALVGAKVLHAFGVSLDAFSVAGGGVLAWIGFSMLSGNSSTSNTANPGGGESQVSLTPLILFAASPGTITGVITLAVAHAKLALPVTALVAVGLATATMWLVLVVTIYLGGRHQDGGPPAGHGDGFIRDTTTRFMGLIVIAMGIQFALTGIQSFFEHTHTL